MWIQNFFKYRNSTSSSRRPTRRPAARLCLEAMEDRAMPSFIGPVTYPAASIPPEPPGRLQDFNGDGYLDYASAVGSNGVTIHLGNGDGTFRTGQTLGISAWGAGLAAGDFNGDGILDLAVTSESSDGNTAYMDVFQGKGDGTFLFRNTYDLGGETDFRPTAVIDLAGNGRDDLVLVGDYGSVDVWLGNADGTLRQSQHFSFGTPPIWVTVRDLNGDGRPDLALSNYNSLSVLLGNGDGTLRYTGSYASGGYYPGTPVVADFDRDGRLDLAVLNGGDLDPGSGTIVGQSLVVLPGNGDGSYQPPQQVLSGPGAGLVGVGDFNADGFPDLAVAVSGSDVSVMLNAADWPGPVASFGVSGFPSPTTAGTAGTFTVTARDASGNTLTNYSRTVHFTSSDPQAGLPADYTFTAADAGVHSFSAILKSAGTQSLTVTDTVNTSGTGTQAGISVNPAAARSFTVAGFPSPITAGVAGSFTVTARDPYGNRAVSYTGTVHFTSSDVKAVLPADYTFTAADGGVHTFSATLKTAGTQSITDKDIATSAMTGTDGGITVNPAAASQFIITGPSSVSAGIRFSLTLTVEDAYGNVVTGYTGTVHFTSTDPKATLPKSYTFTVADKGAHTFTGLVLRTKGTQKITLTDTLNSSLTGSVIESVQ